MRLVVLGLLSVLSLVAPACGDASTDAGDEIDLASLGIDAPADSAGGHFVKVKSALAKGASKKASMTGRDLYHGYTLTLSRGQEIEVRGIGGTYGGMALTALYGPQKSDGSWGTELVKRWSYEALGRSTPIVPLRAERAGKYLLVFGMPQRQRIQDQPTPYSVTFCDGACAPGACVEYEGIGRGDDLHAVNFVSRAEADVARGANNLPSYSTSCDARPRTCSGARHSVCVNLPNKRTAQTFASLCEAKVALRELTRDKLGPKIAYYSEGACQN